MPILRRILGGILITFAFFPPSIRAQGLDPSSQASALVRFIHAVPAAGAVDIYLDGQKIVPNFSSLQVTDYGFTGTDSQEVRVWKAGDDPALSTPLLEQTISLSTGRFYTFTLAGSKERLEGFVFEDHTILDQNSKGSLRLVHLAKNQGEISASVDNAALTGLIAYGEASQRYFLDASKKSVVMTVIDQAGDPLLSTETISLEGDQFKSLFVIGAKELQPLLVSYPLTSGEIPDFPIWPTAEGRATTSPSALLEALSWPLRWLLLGLGGVLFLILLLRLVSHRQSPKKQRRI